MNDPLPIDAVLDDVLAALRSGTRALLIAPPGAGKTTRVAPALLDLARQASEARIAAGIHYRYDVTAAEEIGRQAAAAALAKLKPALE